MSITASVRQTTLLRAELPAATQALAQIATRSLQLNQSSSINKAALNRIYSLNPRRSIKHPTRAARRHRDRPAPRFKSP